MRGSSVTVSYLLRSPSGEPVKQVVGLVDGVPAATVELGEDGKIGNRAVAMELKLPVPAHDITVSVVAQTEHQASQISKIRLLRTGAQEADTRKPNVFAVVIGAGDYQGETKKLPFAGNDAMAFAAEIEKQRGRAFNEVNVHRLIDRKVKGQEATTANIRRELSWLRQTARDADDVAIVFFSGHGKSIPGGASYLLPVDYDGNHDLTAIDSRP